MYCSQADVEKVISRRTLIQLTNDSSSDAPVADDDGRVFSRPQASVINSDVIEDAIRSACELIDAYLRQRYDVVAVKASSPTVLRDLAVNIVRQAGRKWMCRRASRRRTAPRVRC